MGVMSDAASVLPALSAKQADFLDYLLETGDGAGSYRRAYGKPDAKPSTAARKAYELTKNPKIQAHLAAIPARSVTRAVATVDRLTLESLAIAAEARSEKQYAAATGALQFVARLHGLLIDRREVSGTVSATVQVSGEISARAIVDKARDADVIDVDPVPVLPEPTHDAVAT